MLDLGSTRDEHTDPGPLGGVALYRFFDAADQLLYVGITSAPSARWTFHRYFAAGTWWHAATRKTVRWFATREEAAAAELGAIRSEAPLWNSAGAGEDSPRLAVRRFIETTGGRGSAEEGWRNADMAVYQVIASEIAEGIPAIGEVLPTQGTLTSRFGVSAGVARQAARMLEEDGFVARDHEGGVRRLRVVADRPTPGWRPPPLPDGRDALDVLLTALREHAVVLPIAATRQMKLPVSVVRGWTQRHTHIAEAVDEAIEAGRKVRLRAKLGARTDLTES